MTLNKPTRRVRQAKIVATLGPSTSDKESIRSLFEAGVDVFRLNFSHGKAEDHRKRVAIIRAIEAEKRQPIAVLADLQGPKLRLGVFKDGSIDIEQGDTLRLDMDEAPGDKTRVCLPHLEIFKAVHVGSELLLDDGKVKLRIDEKGDDYVVTTVLAGRKLSDRKGVNVPGVVLPLSALTKKDLADLHIALDLGADWIALSFVQRPEDVIEARNLINGRAAIMAKLEKPSAIDYLEEIISVADGVMVARGDLGVELPLENVPRIQKEIIQCARQAGKPVVVATQMLESMIESPTPTRAEASDVATAVYDGADALMLSAETASGAYPIEAVEMMGRVIEQTQADLSAHGGHLLSDRLELEQTASDAITAAARQVAKTIRAAAIVTYTTSGATALRAARERPRVPILGMTPHIDIARRLVLSYGVRPVLTPDIERFRVVVIFAVQQAYADGLANIGEQIVITAGKPFGKPGTTNILRIAEINEETLGES